MLVDLAICVAVVFGADAKAEQPKQEELQLAQIERNIVIYTNAERKRYGLPPLEIDAGLVRSARDHCAWMTRRCCLRHTRKPVAENIAMGQRSSKEVVGDWMSSSGHRANILNRTYRRIGAAAYRTERGTIFWCQQFLR